MLVRDRISRVRIQTSPYICPNCLAKAYTTRSSFGARLASSRYAGHKQIDRLGPRSHYVPNSHTFSTPWIRQATGSAIAATTSPLESSFQLSSGLTFENPEDVRSYLKKWTLDHQKSLRENAPDQVQLQRDAVLPNSLFIRNNTEAAAEAEAENSLDIDPNAADPDNDYGARDEAEDNFFTSRPALQPGDALRIRGRNIRPQLAIYLGNRGVQSLYFLADGRWLADCRTQFDSHLVRDFATHDEMSRIEKHLPLRSVEYTKAEDGASIPFSVLGEIPHVDSRPLLDKLAKLAEDVETARRAYPAVNDRLYNAFADENEFKQERLEKLLDDVLRLNYESLTEGAKMFLYQEVFQDERLTVWQGKGNKLMLLFLPRKMYQSVVKVTQWARSYQDAAARAATGKSVSEELKDNPLIPFISKARRLISKSRKIRLPTMECQLGPTLESVRPPAGTVERRSTGETFTEDEKKIIEFLWLVYAKRPVGEGFGSRRNAAIASLVVRAVGAYPKFRLDLGTGLLFLKELGCLDPWATSADFFVNIPSPVTVLHQDARLRKEKATKAAAELGMQRTDQSPRLPDTMAPLRKDWGDLEVFCVDSKATVIKDDGISVEQSEEFPDHYWLRIHVAHLSAFIPPDSPLLALGPLMGAAHYHQLGSEPFIPFEAVTAFSLKPNRPVLTFSALLRPDGSIKDIDIRPGIVRNVIDIHSDVFQRVYGWPVTRNTLSVGPRTLAQPQADDSSREQEQLQVIHRYRATLDTLQRLVALRWEARFRDMPAHLQMMKLPNVSTNVTLNPSNILQGGREYERIFRSEHLVGDLSMDVSISTADHDRVTFRDQAIKHNVIAGAMILGCESAALWSAARDIPMIYRSTQLPRGIELDKLNGLGPHDPYVGAAGAEGVDIVPSLSLATAGYVNITNPLRRYRDLAAHHQIDAYLKAQAEQSGKRGEAIQYPLSRQDLLRAIYEESDGAETMKVSKLQIRQWLYSAMYRAFYFQEAKLPDVWDVFIDNPVNLGGAKVDETMTTKGTIYAMGLRVHIEPSEQGWEKMAKFRQFIPVKLTSVNPGPGIIRCVAIGPPTDEPAVKDLLYPPMRAE